VPDAQATATTFLSDISQCIERANDQGVGIADSPVFALFTGRGGGSSEMVPVSRVGLSPSGELVVLLLGADSGMRRSLILPPRLGGPANAWRLP
jgi:hypothetical protein